MENRHYNFILTKLHEAVNKEMGFFLESILYLVKSINDKDLNRVVAEIESSKIKEEVVFKIFSKSTLLPAKKVIIAGVMILFSRENSDIILNSDWEDLYDTSLELITTEDEDIPRNYRLLAKYINEPKTNFYHYVCASLENRIHDNYLIMLKGWSSSTPLINSPYFRNQKFGGGFYIRYNGVGIAVDPGCNFVENMHEQGIYISDIDYVIITHSHMDHCHDMESISTLNYEYNKIINRGNFAKFKNLSKHTITWCVDSQTYVKLSDPDTYSPDENVFFKLDYRHRVKETVIANAETKSFDTSQNDTAIHIEYFPTLHHCQGSFGFKLTLTDKSNKCTPVTIGYTSDTAYFDKLNIKLEKSDILIANISELSLNDLAKKTIITDSHLRLQGCINLIENLEPMPKLCIISEFWGGKDDIRLYIVNTLIDRLNTTVFQSKDYNNTNIIAGDVGLTIELNSLKPQCSFCKNFSNSSSISTISSGAYERLKYVCKNCFSHSTHHM